MRLQLVKQRQHHSKEDRESGEGFIRAGERATTTSQIQGHNFQ